MRLFGFPGESIADSSVLVIKSHFGRLFNFTKVILLIRDPVKAALSEFNRKKSKSHTQEAPNQEFSSSNNWIWVLLRKSIKIFR